MTIAPADPDLRKALAKDAEGLLADAAFAIAVKTLRMQWYNELIAIENDPPKVLELAAKLRALDAIPQMLDHLMTSEIMAKKREANGGRR
jgi:hypothetical protein